ncbi:hypothetical protein CRUP_012300, partial [Coryphaenoides rupestris]
MAGRRAGGGKEEEEEEHLAGQVLVLLHARPEGGAHVLERRQTQQNLDLQHLLYCVPVAGHGFVLDKYTCQCRRGFYHPNRVALNGLTGGDQEPPPGGPPPRPAHREGLSSPDGSDSRCLPCREGCTYCRDDTPCLARGDGTLRLTVASSQGLALALCLACMLLVYHFRRNKRIRTSGLILVEAILFGALLLYSPVMVLCGIKAVTWVVWLQVMVLFLEPSVLGCILLRWLRLLGFSITYGTIILKIY